MVDVMLRNGQREVSGRGKRATGQTRGCVCHTADRQGQRPSQRCGETRHSDEGHNNRNKKRNSTDSGLLKGLAKSPATLRKRPADTCAYLRLENLELKEAIPHKITKHVHAERVEKERLLAENEVSVSQSLTPSSPVVSKLDLI